VTDLFGSPIRKRPVGYGNAMFLADLTEGVSDPDMRAKFKAGNYPDIHKPSIPGWRALSGRNTKGPTT
jgi:hypothetical protein